VTYEINIRLIEVDNQQRTAIVKDSLHALSFMSKDDARRAFEWLIEEAKRQAEKREG